MTDARTQIHSMTEQAEASIAVSDKPVSIRARDIAKQYIIGGAEQRYDSFREMLSNVLRSPFQKAKKLGGNVEADQLFWALKDINFDIRQGDIVGVIGHNGAGKSTLLKVLSRITPPTEGEIAIHGQVASLLEVGTGFHPELTGRENIYLNGSVLGMRRSQIDERFDEIVEFADITQFLDTPVKRYSSGMYVRLAFSVAAHLDTDVLLVDEVLAVGDQKFQEKCLGKLSDASSSGRTVLFVSHNLSSIAKLCTRTLVLDKGQVVFDGDVTEGISHYNNQMRDAPVLSGKDYIGELYPQVRFSNMRINSSQFEEGMEVDGYTEIDVTVDGESERDINGYRGVFSVKRNGHLLFSVYDSLGLSELNQGKFTSCFKVPAKLLMPGEHTFSFGGLTDELTTWLWTRDYRFNVSHRWQQDYDSTSTVAGLVNFAGVGERIVNR